MSTHPPKSLAKEVLPLVGVWLALVVLTFTTFALSRAPLGAGSLPVAIAIAIVKTLLVALIFMELLHHRGPARLTLVVAVLFVVLLTLGVIGDVRNRFPLAVPPGAEPANNVANVAP